MAFTGLVFRLDRDRAKGGGRLIRPDAIQQIIDLPQGDAAALQTLHQGGHFADGMEPGINADHAALGQLFLQPVRQLGFGPGHRGEMLQIHLRLHLGAVAPVNEHARLIQQRSAEPGRAGEAGQPGQPIIAWGNIFALMHIRARHQKPAERFGTQHIAQFGKTSGPFGG